MEDINSVNYKKETLKQKLWLSARECCWLTGVSHNTWIKIAKENSVKTNSITKTQKMYLSLDVFDLLENSVQ